MPSGLAGINQLSLDQFAIDSVCAKVTAVADLSQLPVVGPLLDGATGGLLSDLTTALSPTALGGLLGGATGTGTGTGTAPTAGGAPALGGLLGGGFLALANTLGR